MYSYAYYDENGVLKEYITDPSIRSGNDGYNIIKVYWKDRPTITAYGYRFKKVGGATGNEIPLTPVYADTVIPSYKDRDLNYFVSGKTYQMFSIPIDNLANGSYQLTITAYNNGVFVANLAMITLYIEDEIAVYDFGVSKSQFDTIIEAVGSKAPQTDVSTLQSYFTDDKAKKAVADENGDNIALNYLKKSDGTMFEIKYGVNLLDITKLTNNFITKNGTISASEDYKATDFIPVEEGQTISFQYNSQLGAIRFLCAYDENKQPVDASGSNVQINNYVVPVGIKYIRCSIYKSYIDEQTNPMIFVGTEVQEYVAYTPPKWILKANNNNEAYLISLIEETNANVNVSIEQLNFSEWQNYFDKENAILGKYVYNGNLYNNNDYFSSDYIEVEPNTKYSFATASSILNVRFLDEYNQGKRFIQKHESVSTITTGPNTKFLRVSFFAGPDNANLQHACVVKGETPVVDLEHKKLIPEKYLKLTPNIKIFLPKEICCAVGTTIEIYNDQVMPCADKYHFQWICNVGKALNRKFSVTGTNGNVGNYQLTLSIYDDAFNLIASGQATLKIVSPISTNKTICPIGDSLTNAKWWLHYVQTTLSSGKITYVGTRYYQPLNEHHEGRSGWSTTQYLSNSEYDYETPATPNPFWDASNSEFSWSYYKSTYSINPNAVQIWLGTNDLLSMSATQFVNNIKTMIEKIRNADATIPVFVCLTILPAEQNGIGNQQSNDGFASLSGKWQYQWWNTIIDGVSMLEEELTSLNDANLHIIPLVCSHDSKYNFGIVETPVNPHTPGITEPMPVEGVHPQQNGYEQIADILFGCYSVYL